ncbi:MULTISPECIES: PilN domain-containing protein [unclassified Leptolyngbya]|uniref:PilN domain-containing protein n=1 Tax=unclassified Leptolyngbya TaxID=2650499 RepID=UPI001685BBAC|nr:MULTISPECIES: PilN domain-containing protein [unclassified Leptolyngbya]MBD1912789.1 PilN domain-containing protein [Leptolyngbya sp. FACHB-8]MBD2157736.1 PilN domain-containing protein [Leptolyngbya sp. FACHB-16]
MYSLDINFLNDREERAADVAGPRVREVSDSPRPLYLGALVGLLLPALAGGLWFFLQAQRSSLQAELDALNAELVNVQAALQEVQTIQGQVQQIDAENQALATVFDQIQPWSALLQDVRTRTPGGVQVSNIIQTQPEPTAAPPPAPAPAADPNNPEASPSPAAPAPVPELPPARLQIQGIARSFDDVNDFVLLLKQSPFLTSGTVRLVSSTLQPYPAQVQFPEGVQPTVEVELPDVVNFQIEAELTNRPASELLQNMRSALAVGLPARIDALRDLGVIQP